MHCQHMLHCSSKLTWMECIMKMSVAVSMVKMQLPLEKGTLSKAPTAWTSAATAALAGESSAAASMP